MNIYLVSFTTQYVEKYSECKIEHHQKIVISNRPLDDDKIYSNIRNQFGTDAVDSNFVLEITSIVDSIFVN